MQYPLIFKVVWGRGVHLSYFSSTACTKSRTPLSPRAPACDPSSVVTCSDTHTRTAEAVEMIDPAPSEQTKPLLPNKLTLEAWSQGFMIGALFIMCGITLANMRRGNLLHKLILIEVSDTTEIPTCIVPAR